MEAAPCDERGIPTGIGSLDAQLQKAMREDLRVFLGRLLTGFATRGEKGVHSVRTMQLLTTFGWVDVHENYIPERASPLRASLGIRFKSTAAAQEAVERCGALGGSFREGADTLRRLTGMDVKYSKLRDMTLAFGEACLAAQNTPEPDVRTYTKKPTKAKREVPRTLFGMLDGASANCCKADTVGVKGKNGEAGTRQVRVGVFGEYGWLDKEEHPVPWRESFSYVVSGENIAEVTILMKKHGTARGCGTVPRMQCLADGEEALEKGLRDAFPHAEFTNDFYHASEHVHALCMALGLEKDAAQKKYRFLRGLLYRIGADSVIRHVEAHYAQTLSSCEDAEKEIEYLRKRRNNMRYGWLRRNGYLIGSGHVEAAARVLVVRRTKQAGMHWRHANAIRMAAILAHYRSHRKAA